MVSDPAQKTKLLAECEGRKIECSDRNACDVELLTVGGFSPLDGFMSEVCGIPPQCICGERQQRTTVAAACNTIAHSYLEAFLRAQMTSIRISNNKVVFLVLLKPARLCPCKCLQHFIRPPGPCSIHFKPS